MKKICLSVGALMLSGLILASCSFGSSNLLSIKKPKKGKAVDELDIKISNYGYSGEDSIKFKKDDKAIDVFEALSAYYIMGEYSRTTKDGKTTSLASYKTNSSGSYSGKITNAVENDKTYKKEEYSYKGYETNEIYMNLVSESGKEECTGYQDNKRNYTTKGSRDDYSFEYVQDEIKTVAGSYSESFTGTEDRTIDIGIYQSENNKNTSKSKVGNESTGQNSSVYKYVNDTEKNTDDDYEKTHRGTYANKTYSYNIEELTGELTTYPVSLKFEQFLNGYSEEFKDYFDLAFELTENYIILKGTSRYVETADDYAENFLASDATSEQKIAKTKELLDGAFKGSKTTFEIWINHTKLAEDSTDVYELEYSYGKIDANAKVNFNETYTKTYLENIDASEDMIKEMEGKKWTMTGTMKESYELGVNKDDYSKKIDSFKKKAEKNNIFKDMKLTTGGYY